MVFVFKEDYVRDLMGGSITSQVNISIVCDESGSENWFYYGMLIIPDDTKCRFLQDIQDIRCGNSKRNWHWEQCGNLEKCAHHQKNNHEVHFTELDDTEKKHIAKRWMDYLLNDNGSIYFYILGINSSKLNLSKFGDDLTVLYNRFIRTAIQRSVKNYFSKYDKICINAIYHDCDEAKENHEYFPWHSISKLDIEDGKLSFAKDKIEFIDSDHRISKNPISHYVQFIDLILGSVKTCYHNDVTNNDKLCIAQMISPLVKNIKDDYFNKSINKSYFQKKVIEFFPLNEVDASMASIENEKKRLSNFYKKEREIKLLHRNQTEFNFN